MNNAQLTTILNEYPMSTRLDIIVEGFPVLKTTVIEMLMKLVDQPRHASLTFYGCPNLILRERINSSGGDAIVPPNRMWLEMDMR
jgi:hypothetical protein